MYRELPVVSFICAALVLLPLPWHWRARTIPTISLILWMFVATLIYGINAIVWADNVRIVAPVYCDIATKIMVGSTVALPSSIFCLCVNLERIASLREVRSTNAERRRRKIFDCVLCFVVPAVYMALHYVVQGHRFDIVENFGCRPTIYISIASIFIIWIPPALFTIAGGIFSALALRHFFIRRITFARHLQNSNSALTPSRYFRLIAMALVQTIWSIAVTTVNMWYSLTPGLRPWISWADVHWEFSHVSQFPALLNTKENILLTYLLWWTIPVSSLIFVAFFAFGQDAVKEYRACFTWVKRVILRIPEAEKKNLVLLPSYCSPKSLPSFVKRPSVDTTAPPSTPKSFQSFSKGSPRRSSLDTLQHSPAPPSYKMDDMSGCYMTYDVCQKVDDLSPTTAVAPSEDYDDDDASRRSVGPSSSGHEEPHGHL